MNRRGPCRAPKTGFEEPEAEMEAHTSSSSSAVLCFLRFFLLPSLFFQHQLSVLENICVLCDLETDRLVLVTLQSVTLGLIRELVSCGAFTLADVFLHETSCCGQDLSHKPHGSNFSVWRSAVSWERTSLLLSAAYGTLPPKKNRG